MFGIGYQITKIVQITDGPKPRGCPTLTIPLRIEVQVNGGPGVLEISQDATVELREAIAQHLQARGFP
jgi:hypothetical protein